MKVVKPNRLSALTRCFEHKGVGYLGVSVLAFMPFSDGGLDLLSEIGLWTFAPERLGGVSLDDAMPKSRGEYLVNGSIYAPAGGASSVVAEASVGGLAKSVRATGERAWSSPRRATPPRLLRQVPLTWAHTYGGPDFPHNPEGMGRLERDFDGVAARPLPTLEPVDQALASHDELGAPIGFGPIDVSSPIRQRLAGTYDEAWLEQHFPGAAPDLDWDFFNVASRDQQREGPWLPGDAYAFAHMHPDKPTVGGRLPPLRARVFVSRRHRIPTAAEAHARARSAADPELDDATKWAMATAGTTFEEVSLAAQTLWFFPDAERLVLVFTGMTQIRTDDASEIAHLLVAAEHVDAPRSTDHYEAVLHKRLHPKHGVIAALDDAPLLPEGVKATLDEVEDPEGLRATKGLLGQALHRRAQVEHAALIEGLEEAGIPRSMFPPRPKPLEPPPSIEELPALAEQMFAEAEAQEATARKQAEALQAQAEAEFEAAGFDPALLTETPGGPPTWTAQSARDELAAAIVVCRATDADASAFEAMLADDKLQATWDQQERQLLDLYRRSAHMQPPAKRIPAEASKLLLRQIQHSARAGESLRDIDLTGADLTGIDLTGADLRGALLESAILDDADLAGADLTDAVLAHASMQAAVLDRCNLTRTNLGKTDLHHATLAEANFDETVLHGTSLRGASLRGATLTKVLLLETVVQDVDAEGVQAPRLMLLDVDLAGCRLSGADLSKATLVRAKLAGLDLSGAKLPGANLIACDLDDAVLDGADLTGARLVQACSLDRASLRGATLTRANLRGTSMRAADLSGTVFDGADLSGCVLTGVKLEGARGRGAQLRKADLSAARAAEADLLGASVAGAELHGADLSGVNLFGGDLARARLDADTALDGANLERARVHPRRRLDEAPGGTP